MDNKKKTPEEYYARRAGFFDVLMVIIKAATIAIGYLHFSSPAMVSLVSFYASAGCSLFLIFFACRYFWIILN